MNNMLVLLGLLFGTDLTRTAVQHTRPSPVHQPAEPTCLLCVSACHLATTGQDSTLDSSRANLLKLHLQGHHLGLRKDVSFGSVMPGYRATAAILPPLPENFLGHPDVHSGMGKLLSHPFRMRMPRQESSVGGG